MAVRESAGPRSGTAVWRLLALALSGCATRAGGGALASRPRGSGAGCRRCASPGIASFARPSACARTVRPASCCGPRSSMRKTLIHNYGHGGAGMSLSWGTGQMAAELALAAAAIAAPRYSGCGVVGLTTARQLQRRGFDVTIYAAAVPPDTTSNMSLAGFTPTSGLVSFAQRTPAWDEQFRQRGRDRLSAAAAAGRPEIRHLVDLQLLADRGPGVGARHQRCCRTRSRTGSVLLQPGEHPFPDDLCDRAAGDAHRAVDLSRRADAGRRLRTAGGSSIRRFEACPR